MGRVFFVSGIDTGIGKTVATGLMLRDLVSRGIDATSVKLVQTGCETVAEDLAAHREIAGLGALPEDEAGLTSPQIFRFPASPVLAAAMEGRTVDLGRIESAVAECAAKREIVLAEGAGGMLVPLSDDTLEADFAASRGWPLVLATCGRLGSLNHTLLSLEAASARGMRVAGIVYGTAEGEDPDIRRDTKREMVRRAAAMGVRAPVVEVPRLVPGGEVPAIDFSEFFA